MPLSNVTLQETTRALAGNPQMRQDLVTYLGRDGDTGDHRTPEQWLMDDLNEGDTNSDFLAAVQGVRDGTAPAGPTTQPLEQGLLGQVLPNLLADVDRDQQRRTLADALAQQALAGTAGATTALARTQGGGFDARQYFARYPDVASSFAALPDGATAGTKMYNGKEVTANQFAEDHYLNFGQPAGRTPFYTLSPQLAQDYNNADQITAAQTTAANTANATQLTALGQSVAQMQQNLTGNLAEKAAALAALVAQLNSNLDQLDATQKAALTQQIATQQADLEQSVATQRQALTDQIAALQGNASAAAQAQQANLQTELQGLTAAQAPMAAARLKAAQLQATAVNIGLEHTKDQLTADQAAKGYVGGSTLTDSALARAVVGARQQGAIAVGSAETSNAADTRDIGVRGATGQRTIADALAQAQQSIGNQGATGNAMLTGALATGRQNLGDLGATGLSAIQNNTGTARATIGNSGATTGYGNVTAGADARRTLADSLATGTYGLTSTHANDLRTIADNNAAARGTYYDANYNRSLGAALAMPSLTTNLASTLTSLDNYGASGLGRTQNLLSWWASNSGTAPTPSTSQVTASNQGNDIANLGAGLLGAGLSVGSANNWFRPTTREPSTGGYIDRTGIFGGAATDRPQLGGAAR